MRKSSMIILVLLVSGVIVAPMIMSADKAVNFFDAWRPQPYPSGIGCHNAGLPNDLVDGTVMFPAPVITVSPGETFNLPMWVEDFGGTLSDGDLLLGLNILDGDNGLFISETVSDVAHKVDANGDSTTIYEPQLTAPLEQGMYNLKAYGVTGDVDYLEYVAGDVIVVVSDGIVANGYIDSIINYYDGIKLDNTTGYRWLETQKDGETTIKPGAIKGAASIGNLMLDVYEERVRSSLFFGLNNEELALPLDLATGAGDWLVSIAEENATGTFWRKSYTANDAAKDNTVHLPYYEGLAGIISYLGRLYRITHDADYLTAATGGLDFLMNVANTSNSWFAWTENFGDNIETKLSTRWSKGSPGIGSVFLEFYRMTGDASYLTAALGLFKFLDDNKVLESGNAYWYRYATDSASGTYLGRWHGVAGIASFLMDLYEVTGTTAHKDLALSAMDYVVAHADDDGSNGIWFENAVGSNEYQEGWSRGGAGIGSMLMRAHNLDDSKGYIDLIADIYTHYEAHAIPLGAGWTFNDSSNTVTPAAGNPRIATAIGHGIAGMGMFFLQAYQETGEIKYRDAATKVAIGLKELVLDDYTESLWYRSDTEQYIDNYVYYGVGGVATYFLHYDLMGDYDNLQSSIDATEFMLFMSETDGDGIKWVEKVGGVYKPGVLKGAAGNALQLMNIYQRLSSEVLFFGLTTNTTYGYLEAAQEAMVWVQSVAIDLEGGKAWYEEYSADNTNSSDDIHTSYYPGAAGIADVFLRLSQMTGEQSYVTWAESAATFLIAIADTTNGYAWAEDYWDDASTKRSTRWSFGTPGIGSFFINLYQQTNTTQYKTVAEGVATFLDATKVAAEGGNKWYRYADDDSSGTYLGRWHGSAGIATFYMDLAIAMDDHSYFDDAHAALNYVIGQTNVTGTTASWENAVGSGEFQSGWSRGGAGIASTLLRAYRFNANMTYMDYVQMAVNWYHENVADVETGWAWYDSLNYVTPAASNLRIATALGHGIAGVMKMAAEVFYFTRMPEAYMMMAMGQLYIDDVAFTNSSGTYWYKSTNEQYIDSTLYYGTAGVAFALSEMSSFVNLAPEISVTLDDHEPSETLLHFDIDVKEDIGIAKYTLQIDSGDKIEISPSSGSIHYDVANFSVGVHTATIEVTDVGGLVASASVNFEVSEDEESTTSTEDEGQTVTVTVTTTVTDTPSETDTETEGGPIAVVMVIFGILGLGLFIRKRKL